VIFRSDVRKLLFLCGRGQNETRVPGRFVLIDIFRQDCYYSDSVACETRCPAEGIVTIPHEGEIDIPMLILYLQFYVLGFKM